VVKSKLLQKIKICGKKFWLIVRINKIPKKSIHDILAKVYTYLSSYFYLFLINKCDTRN